MNAKEKHSKGTDYTSMHSEIWSESLECRKNIFILFLRTSAQFTELQDFHT